MVSDFKKNYKYQVKIFVVLLVVGGIKDTHLMPQTFSLDTNKNEDYPLCV